MRQGWKRDWVAAIAVLAGLAPTAAGAQQPIDVVMAMPTTTLTFSVSSIAEDAGLYKKEGINIQQRVLVGVASINAVIGGAADFTIGTAPVFLRANAQGQKLLAIANLIDKPMVEIVLRKDVYERVGVNSSMTLAERAKRLKGLTIAIQGVGSIVHAWERFVAARGGLDPENDVRIAPMEPSAMLAALETKAIDGYTTSMPFTTQGIMKGEAVMLASAAQNDAPDLIPFAYGLLIAKPETCQTNREKCARVVRALAAATKLIREEPDKALETVRPRFKDVDPALLASAWKIIVGSYAKDLRVDVRGLANADKINLEAKLLDPKDKLKSYDGLATDEFVR